MSQFKVFWHDSGKEPECPSNPEFPNGIDVGGPIAGKETCKAVLPYPARRIGAYFVECLLCGVRVSLTTAGRPDDPRSVTVPCRRIGTQH